MQINPKNLLEGVIWGLSMLLVLDILLLICRLTQDFTGNREFLITYLVSWFYRLGIVGVLLWIKKNLNDEN